MYQVAYAIHYMSTRHDWEIWIFSGLLKVSSEFQWGSYGVHGTPFAANEDPPRLQDPPYQPTTENIRMNDGVQGSIVHETKGGSADAANGSDRLC